MTSPDPSQSCGRHALHSRLMGYPPVWYGAGQDIALRVFRRRASLPSRGIHALYRAKLLRGRGRVVALWNLFGELTAADPCLGADSETLRLVPDTQGHMEAGSSRRPRTYRRARLACDWLSRSQIPSITTPPS